MPKIMPFAVLTGLFIAIVHLTDLDDKTWYFFHELRIDSALREDAIWLNDYEVSIDAHSIKEINKNASGITFNPDTNSLWVITNKPTKLLELDTALNVKRQIMLNNFIDTEAIAYLGNHQYVITDERSQTLVIAVIHEDTQVIDRNNLRSLSINTYGYGNKGLEGVAYDPASHAIYTVRERDPMLLIKVDGLSQINKSINIEVPNKIDINTLFLDDLSGLHFDSHSNNLLMLSHESQMLAEISLNGDKVSYIDLEAGFNGLANNIKQAEGVTMDDQGNVYILGEPNLIYKYEKG